MAGISQPFRAIRPYVHTVLMKSEFELIEMFKRLIPGPLKRASGIGDDAAVLKGRGKERFLFTTDAMVEGIDYKANEILPEQAGRKALAINLSDIAAMAGEPVAFVSTLGIPRTKNVRWIQEFYKGMLTLAKKYRVSCVGGDLTASRQFFSSIAVLGQAKSQEIILRSGAKVGDWIAVTGKLGGSRLGHHYRFEPRLREARFLSTHFRPTAMIDVSDGLLQDLGHILKSSGVGAELDLDKIPVSKDALRLSQGSTDKALSRALIDGEDFELLFTMRPGRAKKIGKAWKRYFPGTPLSRIGRVTKREGKITWRRGAVRVSAPRIRSRGYTHF